MTTGHRCPNRGQQRKERYKNMKQIYKTLTLLLIALIGVCSNVWGNTAQQKEKDLKNSRTWYGNHATFTLSGDNGNNNTLNAINVDANRQVTISWNVNGGLSINVTKLSLWIGHNGMFVKNCDIYVNGSKAGTVGTIINEKREYSGYSLGNNDSFVFYPSRNINLYGVEITYTITPNAPAAVASSHTIYATLNSGSIADDEKLQLNTSSCFTIPGNDSHFYSSFSYSTSAAQGSDVSKANISNNYFNATKIGTYYVKAKIDALDNCHNASSYSGNHTINVIGHPVSLTMNNGEVFVKVKDGVSASQLDLRTLIKSNSGDGSISSYTITSSNKSKANITNHIFSATECGDYTITATTAQTDKYASTTSAAFTVKVKKITPVVTTLPTASAIYYQQTLVNSTFSGGAATWNGYTVAGSYAWEDSSIAPAAGNSCKAIFIPEDGTRFNTTSCMVNVPIIPIDQTISWNLTPNLEYATGTLMDATATSGLAVTYSSNHPEWGYINENNRLVVVEPNQTIIITAHQVGNDNWNRVDSTKTIITLGANPNQYTDVHASDITYGDLLSASTLSGKVYLNDIEIAGTLSWVDPMIMPNAGTANHMVLFTPTNTAAYSSVYFEVPVTVAKANPVITWNISTALRENTIYSNFVVSTNNEVALTITEASDYLSATGLVLTVGEIGEEEKSGITVTVHQDASDNYNEITSTKTITIYPKVAQCLPVAPLTEDKLGKMGAKYDNSVWCSTNSQGASTFASCDVHYTQAEGIALGTWQDGFTGFDLVKLGKYIIGQAEFTWSTKWVELSFTGIPDRLSFTTELQVVSFNLAGWHEVNVTGDTWKVYQKAPGGSYTQVGTDGAGAFSFNEALNEDTRYIKIEYTGNFAGFVKGLTITRKETLTVDKSSLTFGTEAHPLQEPQTLTLSYSSLGDCAGDNDHISVTSNNAAFYVDEAIITENVGIEQKGSYTIRVRCNDVAKSGKLTFTSNDGKTLEVSVSSTTPAITTTATSIFQTGTEYASVSTPYRAQRTHDFSACFDGAQAKFDFLYIYGVTESSASDRQWIYDASKGYKVPKISASNVHTPCFVYKKDGTRYTYVRTFDASTQTLNAADDDTRVFVGYRPEGPAATAIQLGTDAKVALNNTEIIASGAVLAVNGNATVSARGENIISSASNAAVQLSGASTLTIEDSWKSGEVSAILALRPATNYPSIDLGSASGRVDINGTQLELHNATKMAIAHMEGTAEKYDGEVHINDGSIGGEETLGMPKRTFIDGGTFNDGTVVAYTLKGMPKRPRNSRGEMLTRHTMSKAALEAYDWYGQEHLTLDGSMRVNPMLMDEEVWIFNGAAGTDYNTADSWNKDGVPGEDDDVLINAPMIVSGGELKVHSITINWEDKGKGIPAITVNPDGGLTVGGGGIDALKVVNLVKNLVLKADSVHDSATKGQTGYLRIHPKSAEPMPEATIELFSIGYYDYDDKSENIAKWQYVGSPLASSDLLAKTVYKKSWVYAWNEETEEWANQRPTFKLTPFVGFATTQRTYANGMMLTYSGQIVSSETNANIPLSYSGKGHGANVIANSFVAPIDITKFEDADFKNIDSTVYIFNTGSRQDEEAAKETKEIDAPGQYLAIPIGSARLLKDVFGLPTVIAPMQGFIVHAIGEKASINLNYEKLVWNGDYVNNTNTPLHVKSRYSNEDSEKVGALRISLKANGWIDHLYMLESEQFNKNYESGYDARKRMGDELNLFAVENDDQLSVDATNSIIGTRVGVRTGEETAYTLVFSHLSENVYWALLDNETNETIDINEGTEYTFFAEPNSTITERFMIVESANAPAIATGVDNMKNSVKVHKFIKDNQLFILKDGVLYNAMGVIVR